jgi:electron transfer flavoprotein alpha/beta subunit
LKEKGRKKIMNIIVCAKQVVDVSEMKIDSTTKKPISSRCSPKD